MLQQSIIDALPSYWYKGSGNYKGKFIISPYSEEFAQVEELLNDCSDYEYEINEIKRVQNVDFYGKFLLKKEQYACYEDDSYMRRMFVVLDYDYLDDALTYNLDTRRFPLEYIVMTNYLSEEIPDGHVLLIVNVLYGSLDELIDADFHEPGISSEHYIEYIVDLE